MLGGTQRVVWHQSICASLTAAYMGKNTKQWVKSADVFPVKCTLLLCFCVCCYHILCTWDKPKERGKETEE